MHQAPVTIPPRRFAIAMLLVATTFWGMGFAWAKNVGEAGNASAGLPPGSTLGPVLMLAVRFLVGAVLWCIIFPRSLRGWTPKAVGYGLIIGVSMCAGLILQHLGLDQTSEAVAAFLTNLTVVIVPLIVIGYTFKLPPANLLLACLVALGGIYLLTGADLGNTGVGEFYVILCAVAFSFAIVSLNVLIPRDDPYRLTFAMFLFIGVTCAVVAASSPGFARIDIGQLLDARVVMQVLALTILCTLGAFGLMLAFQPKVDPSRAAIVYLFEPIVAAVFAGVLQQSVGMTGTQILGAVLILLANLVAELKWRSKGDVVQGKDAD